MCSGISLIFLLIKFSKYFFINAINFCDCFCIFILESMFLNDKSKSSKISNSSQNGFSIEIIHSFKASISLPISLNLSAIKPFLYSVAYFVYFLAVDIKLYISTKFFANFHQFFFSLTFPLFSIFFLFLGITTFFFSKSLFSLFSISSTGFFLSSFKMSFRLTVFFFSGSGKFWFLKSTFLILGNLTSPNPLSKISKSCIHNPLPHDPHPP